MMSLTVKFCAEVPVSALVTAEIPGVIALLGSLIPLILGERDGLVSSCGVVLLRCSGPREVASTSSQMWQLLAVSSLRPGHFLHTHPTPTPHHHAAQT